MKKLVLVAAAFLLAGTAGLLAADFDGDGANDIAIFRESNGLWAVKGVTRTYFGGSNDIPVPADYFQNGRSEFAIFRPSSGLWAVKGVTRAYFGGAGDTPLSGGNPFWNIPNGGATNSPKLRFADTTGDYIANLYMDSNDKLHIENLSSSGKGVNIFAGIGGVFEVANGIAIAFSVQTSPDSVNPGQTRVHTLAQGTVYSTTDGTLTNSAPSSADYKEDIQPIDLHAERVLKLEPKSFVWKENGKRDFGYIAEEVREVVPELYREDRQIKGYDMAKLSFYLTEVVKAQDKRISALEEEIRALKAEPTAGE